MPSLHDARIETAQNSGLFTHAPITNPGSCERDHAGPPLRIRSNIDVVFAHKIQSTVLAHAEHRKPGRQVDHLAVLTPCARSKRSGNQETRAGVDPEGAWMRGANVGVLNGGRLAGLL